jgi:hypothetical protein
VPDIHVVVLYGKDGKELKFLAKRRIIHGHSYEKDQNDIALIQVKIFFHHSNFKMFTNFTVENKNNFHTPEIGPICLGKEAINTELAAGQQLFSSHIGSNNEELSAKELCQFVD